MLFGCLPEHECLFEFENGKKFVELNEEPEEFVFIEFLDGSYLRISSIEKANGLSVSVIIIIFELEICLYSKSKFVFSPGKLVFAKAFLPMKYVQEHLTILLCCVLVRQAMGNERK